MGNKRNRRSRSVESQSSDRDENPSEAIFTQEPSLISHEIEAIHLRLSEQNNTKMTQIEQQLISKFEELLKEIRTKRNRNLVANEEDAENNKPSTSNSENKHLTKNHASNTEVENDRKAG